MTDSAAPLRVLRVIARLNVGGPSRHVALLDRGLRQRGYETLLVHGEVAPGEASLDDLVHAFGNPHVRLAHLGRRISAWGDVRALSALIALLFRVRPDVVHTHTAKAGTLGRIAAFVFNACRGRRRRAVVVHTFHGNVFAGYFGTLGSLAVRAVERALSVITDRIAVIAEQQRREVVETYGIAPARKVSVVPLGLDLGTLLALERGAGSLRREVGLAPDDIVFGFVGRFAPIKDVPTLLRAFSAVVASEPRARLLLAGDGETRPEIASTIEALGLRDRVTLAGWQSDLPRLYASVDVLVLSSRNEGTPVAAIEAMAAGLPVVSTAAGGVIDLIEDGRTGLTVPVGDAGALGEAMRRLAASPALRAAMGAAGRANVAARYDHTRLVDDIDALYRAELAMKRGAGAAEGVRK